MNIIFIGAPGAGKGTQACFITNRYGIPRVSTGDLLREAIQSNSEMGKQIKDTIHMGRLIKDELVITLVIDRLSQKDCYNGFLLDGFPRTILQANVMKKLNIDIDYVLELNIPDELVIDRIIGRRIHEKSGRIYHIKFNPPKVNGKDDISGEKLIIRKDDQEEIVRNRLIEYHQTTELLENYYRKLAKIKNIKYIKINGTRSIVEIQEEIKRILG